ncbi:MAG: diguanylate cyclase [Planctomycetota bacterium]
MSTSAGSFDTPPTIRVILIGQTEFEAALRASPGVEVHAAETPLAAIARLGLRAPDSAETPRAVLLGRLEATDRERASIVRALRRVDDSVQVFAPLHEGDWPAFLVDHTIESASDLMAATDVAETGPSEAVRPPHPTLVDIRRDALEAVLEARPVLPVVLAELRAQFADDSIRFTPASEVSGSASLSVYDGATVERGGARFGTLSAGALSPDRLAEAAMVLAQWLALEAQHHQLREAAFRDPSTGAFNRRGGEIALDRAIAAAQDDRRPVSLVLLAPEGRSGTNERLGELVAAIRLATRPSDLIVRWSDDQVAVVLSDPGGRRDPESEHPRAVQAIVARISARHPGSAPRLAAAIATFPWDGLTRDDLVGVADRRLGEAGSGTIRSEP